MALPLPFLLLLSLLFSSPLTAQDEQRPMVSTGVDAEAIARKRPDTAVWLTDEEQNRVLALFQPEQESPARGALLILSDEGVSSAAGLGDALRDPLSQGGWAVMTMGLPSPPVAAQQWLRQQADDLQQVAAEDIEPQANDGESSAMINVLESESPDEALRQYRDRVRLALSAGMNALDEQEYERIVLVGVGRAAGHVTRHAREDGRASNLVWIAPHFYPDESEGLTELLAAASAPSILELYSTFPGDEAGDRSASQRAAALARAGISGYRRQPAAMSRQPRPREAQMLANRMLAWLRSEGGGQ
jgi:hypothetical protein